MNLSNLHMFFLSCGKMIKTDGIRRFNRYVLDMVRRNRVIIINDERGMVAVLFYFLTDDVSRFKNRPMFSKIDDQDSGSILYIDMLVGRKWTKSVREALQEAIETKYPEVMEAHWLREPKNRNVIIKRRRELCHTP